MTSTRTPSSSEPNGWVAWPTCIGSIICCSAGGKVAHLDPVAADDFAMEVGRDLLGAAAAADVARRLGELRDDRLGLLRATCPWGS